MTDQAYLNANERKAGRSKAGAVELHLSELTGVVNHLDVQKIRIIVFFFENRLH